MNTANKQLFNLLVTKNFEPQALDAQGKPAASPEQATMFSFDYKGESGKDYGTVVIMFNGTDMDVYFGDNVGKSMEPEDKKGWFDGFLFQLRQFAKRNVPGTFNLQDLNKLKYSMQGQAAISEGLFESWQGKKDVSYNADATQARLMIKHKRNIGEGEARFRNIQSLFIETADGERFRLPFTKLSAGRAMLEHVRQGGKPYDVRGNHIVTIVNEMNLLSRFRRANQGKIFEGETQRLVEQATHYYETLQNNLKSLSTTRGYSKYFEAWDPAALTDEDVIIEDLRHMFIEQNIDSRIEQALPLLARLQKEDEMKEANIFENWANLITEGTWAVPDTKEKQAQLVGLLSQELPVGPDATNATELLYDLIGDDELFDRLEALAEQDANADAREVILNRLEELKSNSSVAQVIGQLKNPAPDAQEPVSEAAGDVMFKDQDKLDRLERLRDLARRIGNTEKAATLDAEIKAIHAANPVGSQDKGHLEEFAPGGDNGGDEEHLRKLAKQWYEAEEDYDAQEAAEEALAKFGYGISEIEDGSEAIQLVPTGEYMLDWNDNDIIVFNPEDLAEEVKDPRTQTEDPANTPQPEVTPNTLEEDEHSPVANAITRRIMMQRTDLLSAYGPELVTAAIDNVADYVGDIDEIGSSDVSGWINEVERMLKDNPPEAFAEGHLEEANRRTVDKLSDEELDSCVDGSTDLNLIRRIAHNNELTSGGVEVEDFGFDFAEAITNNDSESYEANEEWGQSIANNINELLGAGRQIAELSPNTLKDYIKKASSSGEENSASNLASRAAHKLATGDEDDGEADDHKSFMRSKGIHKAVDRLTQEASDTVELDPKTGKPVAWSHEGDWEKVPKRNGKPVDPRGEVTNMVGKELKKAKSLEESGMSEVDILLQEIARGNVDIYDIYARPKTNIEKFVSKQIHEKYEQLCIDQGYHPDDDLEQILDRIQRELEVEYGTDDNMNIEMEGLGGRIAGTVAGGALGGPVGGVIGGAIGDELTDETSGGGNWLEEMDKSQKGPAGWNLDDYDYSKGKWTQGKPVTAKKAVKDMTKDLDSAFSSSEPKDKKPVKEETALTGQYGHSGKMEPVEGADEDMMARIKFLAGIRENDTPAENPTDSNLTAMKSINSIFLR